MEPFVLRPLVKPDYGVVSAWRLARELAKRFPGAAADRSRDDVLVLLLLQGNDYVPKLRAAPFHACLRAYERAVLEASGEDDSAHFFHYTQNERRQWNAPFAATFFDYLRRSRPRTPTLYDSFDLRDLHERNQTEDIMNLRFDLKEGAASPDEWRCEAVCKEIKEAATAPTKQKAKKKAAAQVLERLGETEWPNGDPICALGQRASLSFDKVSGKRGLWPPSCCGGRSLRRNRKQRRATPVRTCGASRGASTPTSKVMWRTARTATCRRTRRPQKLLKLYLRLALTTRLG